MLSEITLNEIHANMNTDKGIDIMTPAMFVEEGDI